MVSCEASGAREHGHDPKYEASSGRTNNARKGVDKSVWAVQLVEHVGKEVMEEKLSCWKKAEAGRGTRPPRPAGLPYKRSPPAPVFCRQASISFLSLCAQVFVPGTTVNIVNLPKLDSSNNTHP
jgi:hypothetical protein